jgi:hypothetical protein
LQQQQLKLKPQLMQQQFDSSKSGSYRTARRTSGVDKGKSSVNYGSSNRQQQQLHRRLNPRWLSSSIQLDR